MSGPGWHPRGARCRGALACLEILEAEGRTVEARAGGVLHIAPVDALTSDDRFRLSDLKAEMLAWLSIPRNLWPIIQRMDPDVALEGLHHYREALDLWKRFSHEEQAILTPQNPNLNDLRHLDALKRISGGTVQEAAWADPASLN